MYTRDIYIERERETAVYVIEITSGNAASPSLLILKCLHSIRIRLEWYFTSVSGGRVFQCPSPKCPNVRKGTLSSSGHSVSIVTDDQSLWWTFQISSGTLLETDASIKDKIKTISQFIVYSMCYIVDASIKDKILQLNFKYYNQYYIKIILLIVLPNMRWDTIIIIFV